MSFEKLLQAWENFTPPRVRVDDALLVARHLFESVQTARRGGHYKISDGALKIAAKRNPDALKDCPFGIWDMPTVNGQHVKACYIKRMLELKKIIDYINEKG